MNEQFRSVDGALSAIEELRIDSKLGKSKHFNASERKLRYHWIFGVPVIVANLLVGVVLVGFQKMSADPHQAIDGAALASSALAANAPLAVSYAGGSWIAVASILLAFGAALFSAIQTLFNFHKSSEGHRSIGNRYVHVSRQCKELQQRHRDIPFTPEGLWEKYHALYEEYYKINTEAEAFPTNRRDLSAAKRAYEVSPYKPPQATDKPGQLDQSKL
ncbi:SLATT domain-containing protein [Burkholderia ubonensis]|uniref:SLATT domain-containing protein n=1 Tax=Burkholderia ubonensis TaxID=101571 RepID=UPI0008FE57C3|nr:SLATT domain-containing protein [Burkholderia ubonensis]